MTRLDWDRAKRGGQASFPSTRQTRSGKRKVQHLAMFEGQCATCGRTIHAGSPIVPRRDGNGWVHRTCPPKPSQVTARAAALKRDIADGVAVPGRHISRTSRGPCHWCGFRVGPAGHPHCPDPPAPP